MGGPTRVGNAAVRIKDLGQIELGLVDQFLQLRNLADLLEGIHLLLLVAIDSKAGRVVAAVLETGEACICPCARDGRKSAKLLQYEPGVVGLAIPGARVARMTKTRRGSRFRSCSAKGLRSATAHPSWVTAATYR